MSQNPNTLTQVKSKIGVVTKIAIAVVGIGIVAGLATAGFRFFQKEQLVKPAPFIVDGIEMYIKSVGGVDMPLTVSLEKQLIDFSSKPIDKITLKDITSFEGSIRLGKIQPDSGSAKLNQEIKTALKNSDHDGPMDRLCCSNKGKIRRGLRIWCDNSCVDQSELKDEYSFWKTHIKK